MKKYFVLFLVLVSIVVFASADRVGSVDITAGEVITFDIDSISFGGVTGTIKMRLGGMEWYPDAVWLVPKGHTIDEFEGNYTYKTYKVPSDLNMTNNCYTTIYSSGMYAFKASVKDGKFCILADPGEYDIIAEW